MIFEVILVILLNEIGHFNSEFKSALLLG